MQEFLEREFWGNSVLTWGIAVGLFLAFFLLFILLKRFITTRLKAWSERTETRIDNVVIDLIGQTKNFFLLIFALALASYYLTLPDKATSVIRPVVVIAFFIQIGIWANRLVTGWLNTYVRKRLEKDPSASAVLMAVVFVGRLAVWSVVVLLALDNLGVQVTALLAGLGVGGIAVALAVQSVLQDLFASLSIVLDKPFVIGDTIVIGDQQGTVENIGLKTTRIRSVSGELIVFSNADLLKGSIRNFQRMTERRILFSLGVVYQTPHEQLSAIPDMIREIIEKIPKTRFDRTHFKSFGDFALVFEVVYYVLSADYKDYMDTQHAINLEIYRRFAAEKIEFAYPTQMVYVSGAGLPSTPPRP